MKDDNFKFYLDDVNIIKGEGDEMYMEGIASTVDKDTDGEILIPNGFDTSYLMNYGFINWHHAQPNNPGAIIGEPVAAEIRPDNKFYVKAKLYGWNTLAKGVYDMAQNLKYTSNRRLGWSIEGNAIKRKNPDPKHPDYKIVEKAAITGVAITPMPKNAATIADICKGISNGLVEEEYEIVKEPTGVEYLLEVQTEKGTICVTKDFKVILLVNGMEKSLTTTSGAAIMPEHVEGVKPINTSKEEIVKAFALVQLGFETGFIDSKYSRLFKARVPQIRAQINK